jgi:hypothetical protein
MTDYYDGPRAGVADFDGRPHTYDSVFDHTRDDCSEAFDLQPVDEETLVLALEAWAIWLRWETAYHAADTSADTHPALPADRARHDEIAPLIAARLSSPRGPVIRADGVFRRAAAADDALAYGLEVQWTPLA